MSVVSINKEFYNKFPDNPKRPRKNFISPLSRQQTAQLNWEKINYHWRGYPNVNCLSDIEFAMLQKLNMLQICTSLQLVNNFLIKEKNLNNAKERLKRLAVYGMLIRHNIIIRKMSIPIYTLGPAGAEVLGIQFTPNWWLSKTKYWLLKQLLANQLFFRFKKADQSSTYNPTPQPFNGLVIFKNVDFLFCVTGREVPQELKWEKDKRIIMICETIEDMEQIAQDTKENRNIRYVTDYDIFCTELHKAFCQYIGDTVTPTEIPWFK